VEIKMSNLQEKLKNAKETSWPGEDLPKWKLWLYCKWGLLKARILLWKCERKVKKRKIL
jgi:hypothetical protein